MLTNSLAHSVTLQTMLNSMTGISYVVDNDGMIIAYNPSEWNLFARKNRNEKLLMENNVIGKSIYSFISSETVKEHYHLFHTNIVEKKVSKVEFQYRCDAPHIRRDMLMSISPIIEEQRILGILYQSITLAESHRPVMKIFEFLDDAEKKSGWPIITTCSYCLRIKRQQDEQADQWITPEEYYQLGGAEKVRMSHGICPECYASIVRPQMALMKARMVNSH